MTSPLLSLKGVQKQFESRTLFKDLDLTIFPKDKIAITGRSGSGKTTLLNILGLLEEADQGELLFSNEKVNSKNARLRNEKIGFVFQFHYLNPEMTVFENLELPRLIRREKLTKEEAIERLKPISLEDKIDTKAKYLSGGEKQRVAFVRALINDPELVLADEPTGQLDRAEADRLIDLLLSLKQAVVIVTHDRDFAQKAHHHYELVNQGLFLW